MARFDPSNNPDGFEVLFSEGTQIQEGSSCRPASIRFVGVHPTPFRFSTTIGYFLPREAAVSLSVYDGAGRRIVELAKGKQPAGLHLVRWNGRDGSGVQVPSGTYFCSLRSANSVRKARMVLLRE